VDFEVLQAGHFWGSPLYGGRIPDLTHACYSPAGPEKNRFCVSLIWPIFVSSWEVKP